MSLSPLIWQITEILMRAKVCLLEGMPDCLFSLFGLTFCFNAGMPPAAWHSQMATLLKCVLHLDAVCMFVWGAKHREFVTF